MIEDFDFLIVWIVVGCVLGVMVGIGVLVVFIRKYKLF